MIQARRPSAIEIDGLGCLEPSPLVEAATLSFANGVIWEGSALTHATESIAAASSRFGILHHAFPHPYAAASELYHRRAVLPCTPIRLRWRCRVPCHEAGDALTAIAARCYLFVRDAGLLGPADLGG